MPRKKQGLKKDFLSVESLLFPENLRQCSDEKKSVRTQTPWKKCGFKEGFFL